VDDGTGMVRGADGGIPASRLPWAIDMLAASPPLRVSALARLHDRGRLRDARRAGPPGDRRRGHRHDRARCMTPDPHPCGKDCCPPAPEGWTARATKKGIDATLRRTAHGWRMASIQGSGQMSHSLRALLTRLLPSILGLDCACQPLLFGDHEDSSTLTMACNYEVHLMAFNLACP
jgi:hypothetical protein